MRKPTEKSVGFVCSEQEYQQISFKTSKLHLKCFLLDALSYYKKECAKNAAFPYNCICFGDVL